jgi:hypothetical protein
MPDVTHFKGTTITRQQVLQAMEQYDRDYPKNDYAAPPGTRPWLLNSAYKYAVVHRGRFYPPKQLAARLAGGALRGDRLRGGAVNRIFEELGFDVRRLRQ